MYICPRCDSQGTIKEYSHIRDGICFQCSGKGKVNRKPRARTSKKDPALMAESKRKYAAAMALYQNDERLAVDSNHPYFYMHAQELAKLDRVWESL